MSNEQLMIDALYNNGLNDPALHFGMSQLGFESTGFTSHVFTAVNNAGGEEYVGQSTAYDSTIKKGDGGTFAGYNSLNDFAADFIRIISLQRSGNTIGAPINATDLNDYVDRLQANGYFGEGSRDAYYNGLLNYSSKYASLKPSQTGLFTQPFTSNGKINKDYFVVIIGGTFFIIFGIFLIYLLKPKK